MNNNNYQTVQNNFAVPLQLNPVHYGQEFVPVVMPIGAPTSTLVMQPAQPNIITTIPRESDLYVSQNGMLQKQAVAEQCVKTEDGFRAPEGFSFVPIDEYFRFGLNLLELPTYVPEPVVEVQETETRVLTPQNLNTQPEGIPEEPATQKKQGVKHPHRSKQRKILNVHACVEEIYKNKGLLALDDEVLRGEDVLRIHVKTWEGLDLIQSVLEEVEARVPVSRIALPFSMKNKFQKKGFIVYLKLEDSMYVKTVQDIFALHKEHFKKCDVALPTTKAPPAPIKVQDIEIDMFLPPMMKRRESAGMAA